MRSTSDSVKQAGFERDSNGTEDMETRILFPKVIRKYEVKKSAAGIVATIYRSPGIPLLGQLMEPILKE
jgi:hypothetical protein